MWGHELGECLLLLPLPLLPPLPATVTTLYIHTLLECTCSALFPFQRSTTSWKPSWISPSQVLPLSPGSDVSHPLC